MSKKLMISAGEASGELYGALLCRAIRKIWPDIEITGIGGNRMQKEGVHMISFISGALGLTETVRHWKQIVSAFRRAKKTLREQRPDVLVLIDYPDFNIALARKARSAGIPILYYVSPQVWAWRSRRVRKIASLVNQMAVLFPFEVEIYERSGLPCRFVGHPIAETIDISESRETIKSRLGLDPGRGVVALLPGSRPVEIRKHQMLIREVARRLYEEFPDIQIVVPVIQGTDLGENLPHYMKVIVDNTVEAVACADASAIASGTATLEAALLGTPMVVFYRLSPITFFLARLLIKVPFISLVNLLRGEKVVVELIQNNATAEKVYAELKRILTDHQYRGDMRSHLQEIRKQMGEKTASVSVALMAGKLAGWNSTGA